MRPNGITFGLTQSQSESGAISVLNDRIHRGEADQAVRGGDTLPGMILQQGRLSYRCQGHIAAEKGVKEAVGQAHLLFLDYHYEACEKGVITSDLAITGPERLRCGHNFDLVND